MIRSAYRHLRALLLTLPIGLFAAPVQSANIYAYIDADGKLLISEKKADARFVRFHQERRVSQLSASQFSARVTGQRTSWTAHRISSRLAAKSTWNEPQIDIPIHGKAVHYTPLINDIAREVGVNADLLHAIIQVESAYNPLAISPKGAQGLMQLIPATAERFGVDQSFDPAANIRGGARYIKNLLARFDNNLNLAVAAYNAGEGAVQKYKNTIPPYPETQAYVVRVLSLFEKRGK